MQQIHSDAPSRVMVGKLKESVQILIDENQYTIYNLNRLHIPGSHELEPPHLAGGNR
ncbi:hypothetical protein Back11_40590 [Paenibacillus baekrokdamisoli]|uniref:Uncharacterized protein n=1 Tax=Paenibacillus baekrokdamisoli TaxID=1712516 RepID=A0A3G9JIA7_9BACL|nr:hypothetical protein Back11_40590 [Paenibacillus baekrokdamisoli]